MTEPALAPQRITDLPENARPRERLQRLGAGRLSDEELLAIMLRVGVRGESAIQMARRILTEVGGPAGLHRTTLQRMTEIRGVGLAKAAQIKAAVELGVRVTRAQMADHTVIRKPEDAFELLQFHLGREVQEVVMVLLLDTKNAVRDTITVYRGSLNSSTIRIAELFREAVHQQAAAIIIAHNHPSGDPDPSPDDVAVTRAAVQAGKLLDINVLDHIIVGQGKFTSLKQRGLGF